MFPTRGCPTMLALVAALGLTLACQATPALDEIPPGSEVAVELRDGRQVAGKLVSVEQDAVAIEGDGAGRVRVDRSGIANVHQGKAALEASFRQVVVPAGATLEARLETTIASQTSRVEDLVRATLTAPLVVDNVTVAPSGSVLIGTITTARESGRVKGRAALAIQFTRLRTEAMTFEIRTAPLDWVAEASKTEDAARIGIGAVAGAVVGGIAGGGKGAAVGSAIGAGGGSAGVLATRGREIEIGSGALLRVRLSESLRATTPARE
ncbi:MAG: hypothetical protein ACT4QD_16220 [Acidobacteriota bacterium]